MCLRHNLGAPGRSKVEEGKGEGGGGAEDWEGGREGGREGKKI
jgi:hypothetical protein